jgi:hypothetical protein
MRRALALACVLAGCTPEATIRGKHTGVDARNSQDDVDAAPVVDAPTIDAPLTSLPTTPGVYRGSCDGSAAIALDADHFAGFSDNDQRIRVFKRGMNATAIQTIDMSSNLGVSTSAKIDIEDVERIENRIYALSSHGRKNDGVIDPDRYRFVAFDIGGAAPSFTFAVAGSRSSLLSELLAPANWIKPDSAIITALDNAAQLGTQTNTNLAPKVNGINMEGLARAPSDGQPNRLLFALRNPRVNGKAVVVSLLNADAFATQGAKPQFGEAYLLDFGGLGIRGMTWAPSIGEVLIIAGPHDDSAGPFRLYRWRGTSNTTPSFVSTLQPPPNMKPEGLVRYAGTGDIELVFDADDQPINGVACDDASAAQRYFTDAIMKVE